MSTMEDGYLTLPYHPGKTFYHLHEASNGPNAHPQIKHRVTKSRSVEFTWVHTNNGTIPVSN